MKIEDRVKNSLGQIKSISNFMYVVTPLLMFYRGLNQSSLCLNKAILTKNSLSSMT